MIRDQVYICDHCKGDQGEFNTETGNHPICEQTARAIEITGGSAVTLAEALDQWEQERVALAELYDENQALTISFRKYDITMTLAMKLIAALEMDAQMFITEKTRDQIANFRQQMDELEARRAADRENVVYGNDRRSRRTEPTCAICSEVANRHHPEDGGHKFQH